MKNTVIQLAIFIGLVITMAYIGPKLDDNGPDHEVAKEELAKQRQQERFSRAASSMCGNGYAVDAEGTVVCRVRKALKAGRAAL